MLAGGLLYQLGCGGFQHLQRRVHGHELAPGIDQERGRQLAYAEGLHNRRIPLVAVADVWKVQEQLLGQSLCLGGVGVDGDADDLQASRGQVLAYPLDQRELKAAGPSAAFPEDHDPGLGLQQVHRDRFAF